MGKAVKVGVTPADENNQVVTLKGGDFRYMYQPCRECPFRVENTGSFPAEAFRISVYTAYDGAMEQFACHMAGAEKPATCAGFLLTNADHNFAMRLKAMMGEYNPDLVQAGDAELFDNYREMAIANGVDEDDPVLARCRGNYE